MRHTGKTTRLVDEAIQYLFIHGNIFIPTNAWIDHPEAFKGLGQNTRECMMHFIDPDRTPSNQCQTHFILTFRRRLHAEHSGQFIEKTGNYIIITLKNE